MCGISGFSGGKNLALLQRQLESIEHRGRDETTTVFSHGLNFGMNRLAIVDLTTGLYPMRYKHLILLYNGEIYNYHELKHRVTDLGVTLKTTCDAEVILPLFDAYGSEAFSMLEGMFAICILDTKTKHVILCRDKAGEKPLYFYQQDKDFVFASEIKAIVAHPHVSRHIDTEALIQYSRQGYSATTSMISNVQKVLPSEYVDYSLLSHSLERKPYWNLPYRSNGKRRSLSESIDTLAGLVEKSVNLRLLADVPVGSFLSGGIDSSLITLFAAKKKPSIRTFSVAFPAYQKDDESRYALAVAKWLRTNHTVIECTPEKICDIVDHIGELIDDPISDPAFIPTLIMAKEARKKVKVVLTGDGADELFGGYTRYTKHTVIEFIQRIFPFYMGAKVLAFGTGNRRLTNIAKPLQDRYHAQYIWKENEASRLLRAKTDTQVIPGFLEDKNLSALLAMQLADFRGYLAEQCLMKVDKATMAYNLESRAPFLDSRVIQFAFGLPPAYKMKNLQGKYILKKLAERYFPHWFVWRPKHGFNVPLGDWFHTKLKFAVMDSLAILETYPSLIDTAYYKSIISDHMERRSDHMDKIWSMIVLASWLKYHKIPQ